MPFLLTPWHILLAALCGLVNERQQQIIEFQNAQIEAVGSTLIGCEQTDRKAFLMELDPPYCDVIIERWQKFTGKKAERISATQAASIQ